MHPSKVTLRPKVRRPMAWDSTKSAPGAQQPRRYESSRCQRQSTAPRLRRLGRALGFVGGEQLQTQRTSRGQLRRIPQRLLDPAQRVRVAVQVPMAKRQIEGGTGVAPIERQRTLE